MIFSVLFDDEYAHAVHNNNKGTGGCRLPGNVQPVESTLQNVRFASWGKF